MPNDDDLVSVRHAELEHMAKMAATEAVQQTFRQMGVDLTDFHEVNKFRDDLVWVRKYRRFSESLGSKVIATTVAIVTGALIIALWDGFKGKIGH